MTSNNAEHSSAAHSADWATAAALRLRVEEASLNAWPALQQVLLDGWILRFARGFTKRSNSIVPLYANAGRREADNNPPLLDGVLSKVRHCENLYAREQLRTVFRLSDIHPDTGYVDPDSPGQNEHQTSQAHINLDTLLEKRGYAHQDPSLVLCKRLTDTAKPSTEVAQMELDDWLNCYAELTNVDATARKLHAYILRNITTETGFFVLKKAEHPQACLMAVLDRNLVGIFDVFTHPQARGLGLATQTLNTAFFWAAEKGAEIAYLQVVQDNTPAIELYRRLGFQKSYTYWYRVGS